MAEEIVNAVNQQTNDYDAVEQVQKVLKKWKLQTKDQQQTSKEKHSSI